MLIRPAEPKDYDEIYSLVQKAFASAEHSDGAEQDSVNALRAGSSYIPELSLVAEKDGRLIGHIMFTKARVGTQTLLALAPLAVLPDCQKQGVGQALIAQGHKIAQELGYAYSVVLGSETYYPKSGYQPAKKFNIKAPFETPQENFMACKLQNNAPAISGIMQYAAEFGIN